MGKRLLVIDYGSSPNFGDAMVHQVLEARLAARVPALEIRPATALPDAASAGFHLLSSETAKTLVQDVDAVLLFGGSIFFEDALRERGIEWQREARELGIPTMLWGGVQYAADLYRVIEELLELLTRADTAHCRFSGGQTALKELTGHQLAIGGDPMALLPLIDAPRADKLCVSVSLPSPLSAKFSSVATALPPLAGEYAEHLFVLPDRAARSPEDLGVSRDTWRMCADSNWIRHNLASSKLVITSRLHVALTALLHGVPTVGLEVGANKIEWLMREFGLQDFCLHVAKPTFSADAIVDCQARALRARGDIAACCVEARLRMWERATNAMDNIASVLLAAETRS